MKYSDKLSEMIVISLLILSFSPAYGTKLKFIRYSGKLLRVQVGMKVSYFEYEDQSTFHTRQIYCDRDTLVHLEELLRSDPKLEIDGKASTTLDGTSVFYCEGKPNVGHRYRVGRQEQSPTQMSKWIQGQILESDPQTGQLVYLGPNGRRGYLTVSPAEAEEFHIRLGRMEAVEIQGNYRYDRLKKYFTKE